MRRTSRSAASTSSRSRWHPISATSSPTGQDDQRHRFVFNGIWEITHGLQLSAIHYFGAGIRASTNYGGDNRNTGAGGSARLRPNGTIVARNSFIQPTQNKTDIRLQQRVPLGGRNSIDLIAEVFNAFNKENFSLVTQESAANYNLPSSGQNRSAQLGFRGDLLRKSRNPKSQIPTPNVGVWGLGFGSLGLPATEHAARVPMVPPH